MQLINLLYHKKLVNSGKTYKNIDKFAFTDLETMYLENINNAEHEYINISFHLSVFPWPVDRSYKSFSLYIKNTRQKLLKKFTYNDEFIMS